MVTHTRPREKQSPTGTGFRPWSLQLSLHPLSLPLQLLLESPRPSPLIRWAAIATKTFITALYMNDTMLVTGSSAGRGFKLAHGPSHSPKNLKNIRR